MLILSSSNFQADKIGTIFPIWALPFLHFVCQPRSYMFSHQQRIDSITGPIKLSYLPPIVHLKSQGSVFALKSKVFLSTMRSLSKEWDYTLKRLARISRESVDAIHEAAREPGQVRT